MESNETEVLSNADRQRRYRERKKVTDNVTRVTVVIPKEVPCNTELCGDNSINLELCRVCGELLPVLERARVHPGMCYLCVMKKYQGTDDGRNTG